MLPLLRVLLLGLLLLVGCGEKSQNPSHAGAEETARPPAIELTGRVTDAADLLSPAHEQALTSKLGELEAATGHQFVVTTVPSLGGRDIALFTADLGNSWGIGRIDKDDGLILLIAPNERKARIAVGRGLEQVLTKAICQQIMKDDIIPRFRAGDMPGGINAGADALIAILRQPHR